MLELRNCVLSLFAFAALAVATPTHAQAPLDAFADTPEIRAAELSPAGDKLAFLSHADGEDTVVVYDFATGESTGLVRVTSLKARDLLFVSDKYLVLVASKTTGNFWVRGRWEQSAAFSVNLETGDVVQLLTRTEGIYPYQSGLGHIVGVDPDGERVFMPAYMGSDYDRTSYDLLSVSLDSGRGVRLRGVKGRHDTIDWIVNENGKVVAREDLNARLAHHEITSYAGSSTAVIYSVESPLTTMSLVGAGPDGQLITIDEGENGFLSVYSLSPTTGEKSGPLMQRDGADVGTIITDINRRALGVRYTGMRPAYEMFDPELTDAIDTAQDAVPNSSIWLDSWSSDLSKLLFFVDGGDAPQRYILMDRADNSMKTIINPRPQIQPEHVGEVAEMHYYARDDLKIPGVITWPIGSTADTRTSLPLVVLPHGGPEAFDSLGWDWLAQFIANQGYMVFQPNFRGSAGFGLDFRNAGRGEWGRKMQDDITDGVDGLISAGLADPERICIVGWSYGGYAALMGGASTPDKYQCVASIAGVSDLRAMLSFEAGTRGSGSRALAYWTRLIGDPDRDRAAIDAVSPVNLAAAYKAPVLLIHGTDDTIVEALQSDRMERALNEAGKQVSYIRIKGDDHSLTNQESRRTALQALADFLKENLAAP